MKAYLFKYNLPVKKVAGDLGISVSYLYQLIRKERYPSLELALKIEEYTMGEITAKDLRNNTKIELSRNPFILNSIPIEEKLKFIEKVIKSLEKRIKKIEDNFLSS